MEQLTLFEEQSKNMPEFVPNEYQAAVKKWLVEGGGNGIVSAVAGSGKTTLLVWLAEFVGTDRAVFVAFNKHIAEELKKRLKPTGMEAKTIHSAGYGAVISALPGSGRLNVDAKKYWNHVYDMAQYMELGYKDRMQFVRSVVDLVDLSRQTMTDPKDVAALNEMALRYTVDGVTPQSLSAVPGVLAWGVETAIDARVVDFTDMIWLPHVLDDHPRTKGRVRIKKYDWLFVDECLPYKTPVHMADGSSMKIGDIVEQRLPVTVLSYDAETGMQKACRVIGWHKILNQKPLVKIKARWSKQKGTNFPTNFVVCTTDHKVWADGAWVEAGNVTPGMTVQIETSAHKSQAYKITTEGRATLSKEMAAKNDLGAMGHNNTHGKIPHRGGNGRPLSLPQSVLLEALGAGWAAEHVVKTYLGDQGYPNHYKIDIANPVNMIAIEVDGPSHGATERQEQDRKKQDFLESTGWIVFRFSNRDAVQSTESCVAAVRGGCAGDDCPMDAVVESVEPVDIPDYHVYDITVEDCHNFYANGILVHNCQDLNVCQRMLVMKMRANPSRMLFVGDPRQAIYFFAGADANSWDAIISKTNATQMPLSVSYRCPTSHVELAKRYVPEITAAPDAQEGRVIRLQHDQFGFNLINEGDLILCRTNAPLLSLCLSLIARGVAARVRGRDIGKAIVKLARSVEKFNDGFSYHQMSHFLRMYEAKMIISLRALKNGDRAIQALQDRAECLRVVWASQGEIYDLDALCAYIESLFSDDRASVYLSSIHKAKGLENDRVIVIRYDKMPLRWADQTEEQLEQEFNLMYVAFTRSKRALVLVAAEPK